MQGNCQQCEFRIVKVSLQIDRPGLLLLVVSTVRHFSKLGAAVCVSGSAASGTERADASSDLQLHTWHSTLFASHVWYSEFLQVRLHIGHKHSNAKICE